MINLNDIEKKDCFKYPENYFEEFEQSIEAKVKYEIQKRESKFSFDLIRPYIYLAAGMIILVALIRIGLEVGIGDYKKKHQTTDLIQTDNYYENLYEQFIADDHFIMSYIFDEDYETSNQDIDIEYLEDYLAQYIYEFDIY